MAASVPQSKKRRVDSLDGPKEGDLVCICNKPFSEKIIVFQCEGPCGKWMHPECCGETAQSIKKHFQSGAADHMRFFCPICREKDPKEANKPQKPEVEEEEEEDDGYFYTGRPDRPVN